MLMKRSSVHVGIKRKSNKFNNSIFSIIEQQRMVFQLQKIIRPLITMDYEQLFMIHQQITMYVVVFSKIKIHATFLQFQRTVPYGPLISLQGYCIW